MTTRITRPINDDDRRAAALAAVIVNDTTLLSEHDDGRPELAGRQAEVRNALRTGLSVFVKAVVRRVHAASLILRAPVARSGFSQTSATGAQLRGCPDHRSGLAARAAAQRQARWASTV